MLNKIEFKGNEAILYAVVLEVDGVPGGSYMYKTLQTATQKYEEMTKLLGPTHGLILYTVDLTWTVLDETTPAHIDWHEYKQQRDTRNMP